MGPIRIHPLSHTLHVFPNLLRPPIEEEVDRGSRKRQTTGDNHNGGGRDKKIKEHLYDRNYDPDISTDNTVGDELLNDKIQTMRVDTFEVVEDLNLFARRLTYKYV